MLTPNLFTGWMVILILILVLISTLTLWCSEVWSKTGTLHAMQSRHTLYCFLAPDARKLSRWFSTHCATAFAYFLLCFVLHYANHKLHTKSHLYSARVTTVLWILNKRMWAKVQAFHMRCQCRILSIRWNDFIPNVTVVATSVLVSINIACVRWLGLFAHITIVALLAAWMG